MSKARRIDVPRLIEEVERRPCLWDKTLRSFKDKAEKQKAWKEIFSVLHNDFHDLDKAEQRDIGEMIIGKWSNLRDSYVKSLKKEALGKKRCKYLYHAYLQFLTKVIPRDNPDSNSTMDYGSETNEDVKFHLPNSWMTTGTGELPTTLAAETFIPDKNVIDEDSAFFISITPSVQRMSPDDKLEFRMGVLQLIKDINERCEQQSLPPPPPLKYKPDSVASDYSDT